jgi:O-antigen/teichoic acid export membrane protein
MAIQASAFRLLFLLLVAFAIVGLGVLFLPLDTLLKLKTVNQHSAAITLYLLIMQIGMNMIFSLLTNSFMVVGQLHRGNYWGNAQRLAGTLTMALAIVLHSSFPVLAGSQVGVVLLFVLLVLVDIRRTAAFLVPPLSAGSWKQVGLILKPSGHFGLIAFAGFLTWQGPVIMIQRVLGPTAVGLFALVRVVFQMSRQLLAIASSTISQDITLMVGQQHWKQLRRLYDLSERIVLFLIPIVSIGVLLLCPFLFTVWLHKRALYDPVLCVLMAMVSAVLGIKEHKTQFQSSSNQHEALSVFMLCGYAIMLLVSVFTMKAYGLVGFIVTWLVWEIIQTGWVLRLNDRLFPPDLRVSAQPVIRLTIFMTIAFALASVPASLEAHWPLFEVVLVAIGVSSVFGGIAYFLFEVDEVRALVAARVRGRFAPGS